METSSSWSSSRFNFVTASFTHLYPYLFPHFYKELKTNAKIFADDTSLFNTVKDINERTNVLNNDLSLISKWVFSWKILFNPDPSKPAQEVLFSSKKLQIPPTINLSNIQVVRASHQNKNTLVFYLMRN